MSDWWSDVEEALARLSDDGPDPWAGIDVDDDGGHLTEEQRAFLAQLDEMPRMHLDDSVVSELDEDD